MGGGLVGGARDRPHWQLTQVCGGVGPKPCGIDGRALGNPPPTRVEARPTRRARDMESGPFRVLLDPCCCVLLPLLTVRAHRRTRNQSPYRRQIKQRLPLPAECYPYFQVPGQGGFGHFNERDNDYVQTLFQGHGLEHCRRLQERLREQAGLSWFKQSLLAFRRGSGPG